jgi:hypothetical protein
LQCFLCAGALANLAGQLAEGGFLLAYEFTSPTACYVWGLDARTWGFADERDFGLWMSRGRWQAALAAAGLVMVAEHWCAHRAPFHQEVQRLALLTRHTFLAPRQGRGSAFV